MKRTEIAKIYKDCESFGGQTVTVGGWARTIRDLKNFGFIQLNDGSCFDPLQVVFENGVIENYQEIAHQNVGTAFIVTGTLVLTPDAKQPFELKASSIEIEGVSAPEYPLQKKRHMWSFSAPSHLRPRTNLFSAVFRVRSVAAHAIHTFFQDQASFMSTHLSSPPRTPRARAKCSA
jgi:asparaginyl-tRNA synthetase